MASLQAEASIWTGGTYLRGSLVRDEPPYDDVDVFEVGYTTTPRHLVPHAVDGVRIEYATYTPPDLRQYLGNCPRSWYMHYDATSIHPTPEAEDLLGEVGAAYKAEGKAIDYITFLVTEDTLGELRPPHTDSAYEFAKNLPGGKRSIMRAAAMLRAMYPEFEPMTTPQVLDAAVRAGILPAQASVAVHKNAEALLAVHKDIGIATGVSEENAVWVRQLREQMLQHVAPRVGSAVMGAIDAGLHSKSGAQLSGATRTIHAIGEPWRRWIVALTLAQNPWLPNGARAMLSDLFAGYSGTLINRCLENASNFAGVTTN